LEKQTRYQSKTALAEKYLVRVWAGARSTATAEAFDQLWVENDASVSCGIDALPPTSSVIREHIHRGTFLVYQACQLLMTGQGVAKLKPVEHG